jgi:hypothetical protein
MDASEPTLKELIRATKVERDIAQVAVERAAAELRPEARVTEDKIATFVGLMRHNLTHGPVGFRRAYLRAVVDDVQVDDNEVRIMGRRTELEEAVLHGGPRPHTVPSLVRVWRCCQTDANSSQFGQVCPILAGAERPPLGQSGDAGLLVDLAAGEASVGVEVVVDGGVD